jgi:RNA-directed DNA polymerase
MPRRDGSPRPVTVLSTSSRILYSALVDHLRPSLIEPTRGFANWSEHRAFGLRGEHQYVLELDIAACYEYVVHTLLCEDLILHTSDIAASRAIESLLTEIYPLNRGLPQMMVASDLLADVYLSRLDRRIQRDGWNMHRFADDIRVIAESWEASNECLAKVAHYARDIGLILGAKKSNIYKRETLQRMEAEDNEFFKDRFDQATDALTETIFNITSPYEEVEIEEHPPEALEALLAATWLLLNDWYELVHGKPGAEAPTPMRNLLGRCLILLQLNPDPLPAAWLREIVFHEPLRLEQVCRYLIFRSKKHSDEDHWPGLADMCRMSRQTPWESLWLLHVAQNLHSVKGESQSLEQVRNWATEQLGDSHEIVRCQAAWFAAKHHLLNDSVVSRLYLHASPLTQPALTAAAVLHGDPISRQVLQSLLSDSPLNKEAGDWAQTQ